MRNILYLLFALFILSCSSDYLTPQYTVGDIDLTNMEVGQQSYYLKFASSCDDFKNSFELTGDTLAITLVEKHDSLFFEESLTPLSSSIHNESIDTATYYVRASSDYLLIPNRGESRLFYFYGSDTIRLRHDYTAILKQSSCRMMIGETPFVGDEIGLIKSFVLGPYRINYKTAVSCVPGWFQMEAYLVYDQQQLYFSETIVNDQINGWVKL